MSETACPVSYDLVQINPAAFGYLSNEVGHVWADPSIDHAVEWMQRLYREQSLARDIGLKGQKIVHEHYRPEIIVPDMKSAFRISVR